MTKDPKMLWSCHNGYSIKLVSLKPFYDNIIFFLCFPFVVGQLNRSTNCYTSCENLMVEVSLSVVTDNGEQW